MAAPAARAAIVPLAPEVAARIAAGEVIERPAAVLKELVENALDAGARRIEVDAEQGGIERLRVRDDGCGIPACELAAAFARHATSKLRTAEQLAAVRTLGFRGEALSAVAAAAEVEIVSRPPEQPAAATARYRDGRPAGGGAAAAAAGTSVDVRGLFAALPARRRFLRSPRAEGRALAETLSALALAHPAVAFRLTLDGRRALATSGGALADAIAAVHGPEVAAALLALAGERAGEDGARAVVGGAVVAPAHHRASRRGQLLVANGRVVRFGALAHALERAYEGLLPPGRHPLAVLRVTVPPEQADANVHPAKAELRFRHERLVFAAVERAVRAALERAPAPAIALPAAPSAGAWGGDNGGAPPAGGAGRALLAAARAAAPPVAGPPGAAQGALPLRERLPALRPLGQLGLTYLAAEAPDGLYLVDQHAAHERVQYERLLAWGEGEARSQPLLQAAVVALSPVQVALAREHDAGLAALGWELGETDGPALLVRALPALLPAGGDPARALADYLERLEQERALPAAERPAAALACRAAVRAGDRMGEPQQRALLEALERTASPLTCPHGRPTVLHLSEQALARSFGRR